MNLCGSREGGNYTAGQNNRPGKSRVQAGLLRMDNGPDQDPTDDGEHQ